MVIPSVGEIAYIIDEKKGKIMPRGVYIRTKPRFHTEETKQKISRALRGRPSPLLGRHLSEETRRKMSESSVGMRGKHHTEKSREKMAESQKRRFQHSSGTMFDKHHTKEARKKISESRKGIRLSEEHKRKISESNVGMTGKHHSEETKRKMSESRRGFLHSKPRKIFYNNTWFRSGWEAKYAAYLDKWGIKWEYEIYTFLLKIEGKETSYTPDFYLPEFGIYHEVKGWTRPGYDEMRKIQPTREQHGISLTIIDYKLLKRMHIL